MNVVKSGWLYRQSTVLRKWKRSWVELTADGLLKYYETESSSSPEGILNLRMDCVQIKTGKLVEGVAPPPGYYHNWLFSIESNSNRTWIFCGESLDDMKAWHMSLEQARIIPHTTMQFQTPGYAASPQYYTPTPYYSQAYQRGGSSVTYVVPPTAAPPGYYYPTAGGAPTTVIYRTSPNGYHRGQGRDLAMGVLAGAAIGSMVWAPMLWW